MQQRRCTATSLNGSSSPCTRFALTHCQAVWAFPSKRILGNYRGPFPASHLIYGLSRTRGFAESTANRKAIEKAGETLGSVETPHEPDAIPQLDPPHSQSTPRAISVACVFVRP